MFNKVEFRIKKRIISIFFILLIIFVIITGRLAWIQLINNKEYQQKALDQRLRKLKVEPKRGVIYDQNGKELAVSASSETVVAIPQEINDPDKTARKLSRILDMDYETVYNRVTRNASAVYVKRKVEDEIVKEIKQLNNNGLFFKEESKRFYPKDDLASHVLGFAGIDSQGLDGIELSYDKYLKGIPGKIAAERDAAGKTIPEGVKKYIAPQNGYNLYLTIDEVIQYIAERELDNAMENYQISGGTIIVMDPDNGAIKALANKPDYNPNEFQKYPQKHWRNRAISDSFEPGSTFKIITTASALEEGVVSENDSFNDPGHIIVSGERIHCWKAGGHGHQSFAEVVKNSCNPGFVQVGMRLGKESFYNYINAFGFGQETGVNLPGEAKGLLSKFDNIGPVELATMSFGHGITVTPVQLINAVSAIANDGMLLKPRLVNKITNKDGEIVEKIEPTPVRQVISKNTAQRTRKLLARVVAEGTGKNAQINGYKIGGKTGTAKHYKQEIYDSSFIGMVPIDDPQLVILVVLYDVTGYPYYGSQTAAPTFRNVALDTLRYLEIPPSVTDSDNEDKLTSVKIPNVINKKPHEAEKLLRNKGLDVKLVGSDNKVIKQVPLAGARVKSNSTVVLFTDNDALNQKRYYTAVPNLKGMSVNKAESLLAELGLKLIIKGDRNGEISEQEIKPGERVRGGSEIVIETKEIEEDN